MIKMIKPRLREIGQIKIGGRNFDKPYTDKYGTVRYPPEKYDHFMVTRGRDDKGRPNIDSDVHKKVGQKPTRLKVVLPFDTVEANFRTNLAEYSSKGLKCHGDGETANRLNNEGKWVQQACPCPQLDAKWCKPHGVMGLFLEDVDRIGGLYVFRTTSWNTIEALEGSMKLFLARGIPLSSVPFDMVLTPADLTTKKGTIERVHLVHLEFDGRDQDMYLQAQQRAEFIRVACSAMAKEMAALREQAALALEAAYDDDDADEVTEEFYPENLSKSKTQEKAERLYVIDGPKALPPAQATPPKPEVTVTPSPSAVTESARTGAPPVAPVAPVAPPAASSPADALFDF